MEKKETLGRLLNTVEVNIVIFAFLLNFAWEILQAGLYRGFNELSYERGVSYCTRATLADTAILLVSFWLVAWLGGNRDWPLRPGARRVVGFTSIGLVTTVILEILSTRVWGRWSYAESMPLVPILDVGMAPFLQWVLLPPLTVWFVRRQISQRSESSCGRSRSFSTDRTLRRPRTS